MPMMQQQTENFSSEESNISYSEKIDENVSTSSEVSTETFEGESKSIILDLISQAARGIDLHKITFPTFILEPRSMLERITDFMSHPELMLNASVPEDPVERFLNIIKYFLSGWHIRPKGAKKPYNSVLGEFFRCRWECSDGSSSFYIGEQVSHHPPASAYIYANPRNNLIVTGNLKPKGKFLGNSVASYMNGSSHVFFINRPDEEYIITNPNVYARGVLFGTLLMELGDEATITCKKTGLTANIQFKVKGYFTGCYNAISGTIESMLKPGEPLYEISGKWTDKIFISKPKDCNPPILFLDVNSCPITPKIVPPLDMQSPHESRLLWAKVTEAVNVKDYDLATEEKIKIEDSQRHLVKLREDNNFAWRPKFFRQSSNDFWQFVDFQHLTDSPDTAMAKFESIFSHLRGSF